MAVKGLRLVYPPHFLNDFQEKYFSCYILVVNKFHFLIAFTCIAIVCFAFCDVINFEIKRIFLSSWVFLHDKSQNKNLNILRTKIAFKVK